MIQIQRFVNELMTSNCFVVWDDDSRHCVIIDPASEKAEREIQMIEENHLFLDYILLTHEHTDHTWGVNALVEKYDTCVVCSLKCKTLLPQISSVYFRFYYDDPDYNYEVCKVDYTTEELGNHLSWDGKDIEFIPAPGHSTGSICIRIGNIVFSGDTLMQFKPYVNRRSGSKEVLKQTINNLLSYLPSTITIYPGHGDVFPLSSYINPYK